ncbi:DUF4129 domain-containing protein [Paenibacillus sp. NEAU-GSW1]|uniref:DUF4129 domain-containing protein n=1 Tax=Paenibacillus sp. NEAU-GSW1 TaxID=2682486 RepID=UPI0012E2BFD9|nr:DUF4129 domain-containing protein [Paenibacillus sp. NEAU-GSW1]MUT67378.1 DUF4129 domain-containing protein [Paenibacillus sp. NEAU-GSW1]
MSIHHNQPAPNIRFDRTHFALAALMGTVENLFLLPLHLIAAVYALNGPFVMLWLLALPLIYTAGYGLNGVMKLERRIYRILLALATGGISAAALLALDGTADRGFSYYVTSMTVILLSALVSLRGMRMRMAGWRTAFPNQAMLFAIFGYVVIQLFVKMWDKLEPFGDLTIYCGIACVILFFFIANERLVSGEAGLYGKSKSAAAAAGRRQNRWMTVAVVVVLCIFSLFRQLQHAVESAFRYIVAAIMDVLNRPVKEQLTETPEEQTPPPPAMPEEIKEPAQWLIVLEQILRIAGTIIVIIVLCVLLYFLGRTLYRLSQRILAKIWERSNEKRGADDGYTDEVESIIASSKWRSGWRQEGSARKEDRWSKLTSGAERIRYLYRRFVSEQIAKGYAHRSDMTPQEVAGDIATWRKNASTEDERRLIRSYEEVRYGERELDAAIAEQLKKRLDESSRY